jgi:hypothetical protein
VADVPWVLLQDSPVGGVVEGWFGPDDARFVLEGLQGCGLDPATVPEVWCFSAQVEGSGAPLGLGPTVAVETGRGVGARRCRSDRAAGGRPADSSIRDITMSYLTSNVGL